EMAFAGHCGLNLFLDALAAYSAELAAVLFNAELGAVIQVHQDATPQVLVQFSAAGLADCVAVMGQPVDSDAVGLKFTGRASVACQRRLLQRQWAQTSYAIQRLRDNVQCAEREFDALLEEDHPGLSVTLGSDVYHETSAPYFRKGAR